MIIEIDTYCGCFQFDNVNDTVKAVNGNAEDTLHEIKLELRKEPDYNEILQELKKSDAINICDCGEPISLADTLCENCKKMTPDF